MFLGALSDLGLSLEDLRRQRKHRKGSSLIPFAMLQHCKQGYQNIAIDAALGKPEAYGPFLRMMAVRTRSCSPGRTKWARTGSRSQRPSSCRPLRPRPRSRRSLQLTRRRRALSSAPTAKSTWPERGGMSGKRKGKGEKRAPEASVCGP